MIDLDSAALNNYVATVLGVGLVGVGIYVSIRRRRRERRKRLNQCLKCGYDRAGLAKDAVCPECGAAQKIAR